MSSLIMFVFGFIAFILGIVFLVKGSENTEWFAIVVLVVGVLMMGNGIGIA